MGFTRRQLLTGLKPGPIPPGSAAAQGRPWRARVTAACLARRGIECRLCGETCSVGAIRFRPRAGSPTQPHVDTGRCTGCGDCLPACPVAALAAEAP